MAIAITQRGTPLHSTANTATYTMTDAGTPTASRLLIAKTATRHTTGLDYAITFSGYDIAWTKIGELYFGSGRSLQMWAALSAGATSTDPVLTPGTASVCQGAHIVMYEVTLDTLPSVPINAFRNQGGAYIVTGVDEGGSTTASCTLASAAAGANRPIAFMEKSDAVEDIVPRASWTQLDDNSFTSPTSVSMDQWRSDTFETSVSATWATVSVWGMIAAEIIADAALATTTVTDPFGMSGFFGG